MGSKNVTENREKLRNGLAYKYLDGRPRGENSVLDVVRKSKGLKAILQGMFNTLVLFPSAKHVGTTSSGVHNLKPC